MWRGAGQDASRKGGDRGQSVVIGSILIFGFLVAALGAYQITIVPDQNKEVEFNHQEDIKEDFSELYADTLNAAAQNEKRTSSFKLGARYPPRALALNPPAASGTLRTETFSDDISVSGAASGAITDEASSPATAFTMSDFCGSGAVSDTKALVYEPDYNVLSDVGTLGYENSARYQDVNDDVPNSNQDLVDSGEITIIPVTEGSITRTSTSSETVTIKAGATGGTTVDPTADWTLTIPTRLSQSQWSDILEDEDRIESVSGGGGTVDITFKEEDSSGNELTYDISCTPIGVNDRPENNPTVVPSDDDSDASNGLNPVGPGALELESASRLTGSNTGFEANFFNNAGFQKRVTKVRVAYISSTGDCGSPCEVTLDAMPSTPGGEQTVEVGGQFESVSATQWTWLANSDKNVEITGLPSSGSNNGIAIEFKVQDASGTDINTYFVSESS